MGIGFPGFGVRDDCEPSYGYWILNPINHDNGEERKYRHSHPRKGAVQLTGETEAPRWARLRILSKSQDAGGSKDGASLPGRFRRMHLYPYLSFALLGFQNWEKGGFCYLYIYGDCEYMFMCKCLYVCVWTCGGQKTM